MSPDSVQNPLVFNVMMFNPRAPAGLSETTLMQGRHPTPESEQNGEPKRSEHLFSETNPMQPKATQPRITTTLSLPLFVQKN
jgi:hypothetical protein